MNNSSENRKQQKNDEFFLEIPPQISQQLKHFVSEKWYLFDYYRRHKNLKQPTWREVIFKGLIDFFWKKGIPRILSCIILFITSAIFAYRNFINEVDILIRAIILLLCILLLLIQTILFLIPSLKQLNTKNYNPIKYIDLASTFNPKNHLQIIENIGKNNSIENIKLEIQRFQIIFIAQTRAKDLGNAIIPLISFFYAILIFFIFGIPENWGSTLEIATITGFVIIPLITIIFSFLAELSSENLLIYQHYLFILKEALIIAQEKEQKSDYSNENKESQLIHEASPISENPNDTNCLKKFIDERK